MTITIIGLRRPGDSEKAEMRTMAASLTQSLVTISHQLITSAPLSQVFVGTAGSILPICSYPRAVDTGQEGVFGLKVRFSVSL